MTEPEQMLGRRVGRPRVEAHEAHTLWVTAEGWAWATSQAQAKGHKTVSKWISALGQAPLQTLSQATRRKHGLPTTFEADADGSYAWSVAAVQERHGFRTIGEFAQAFGVSPRTVESWRTGRRPSRLALEKLRKWAQSQNLEPQQSEHSTTTQTQ